MKIKTHLSFMLCCFMALFCLHAKAFATTNKVAAQTERHAPMKARRSKEAITSIVNINTADAKTIATLKRIGAKKAKAIVEYRQQHGKFKSIEELAKIKGVSQKIIAENKSRIRLH